MKTFIEKIKNVNDNFTRDEEDVSRLHTSDGDTFLLFGFNNKSQFLHTTVLVPLYVPHDGHFFTPLLVDRPKSDSKAFILLVWAIMFNCSRPECNNV